MSGLTGVLTAPYSLPPLQYVSAPASSCKSSYLQRIGKLIDRRWTEALSTQVVSPCFVCEPRLPAAHYRSPFSPTSGLVSIKPCAYVVTKG